MKRCPTCQAEYPDEFKFCRNDATLLEIVGDTDASNEQSSPINATSTPRVKRLFSMLGVILMVILALGLVIWKLGEPKRELNQKERIQALSNVKQIGLGLVMYAQDYDERLPPSKNWKDAIFPYIKSEKVFQSPRVPNQEVGYAYNTSVNSQNMNDIPVPANTVATFESPLGGENPSGGQKDALTPVFVVAFGDGHAKEITTSDSVTWTFSAQHSVSSQNRQSTTASAPANTSTSSHDPLPGERFPQTRRGIMSEGEINVLNYSDTRYALNEVYARHGYSFVDKAIYGRFRPMMWYHPEPKLTSEEAETRFTSIEKENSRKLGSHREVLQSQGRGD
jgi:YARHG domain